MDYNKLVNRLGLLIFCVIASQPGGLSQTITSFTVAPNPLETLNNFVFFGCTVESFDPDQMVMAWRYNGRIFVDVVYEADANFRLNINDIFGFEVNPLYFGASIFVTDENDQIYQGQMDIFVDSNSWMVSGDYECLICRNNGNGRCEEPPLVLSGEETLNVNYFPPDPYPQLESTAMQNEGFLAVIGSETMVSCYSVPGFPEVEFVLSKGNEVVDGQRTMDGDFVFYNYTFIPTENDDGVIFSCTIQTEGSSRSSDLPAVQLVSIPQVEITGPSMAGISTTLVLTCRYTSATSTPVANYVWNTTNLKSGYNENTDTLTIPTLLETDNGAIVTCMVTDTNGMTGVGTYTIIAVDPSVIPTTLSPSASSTEAPPQSPVAIIVVVCIVVLLLLLLLIGTVLWWSRHHQKPKKSGQHFEKKPTTNSSVNKYDNHSDKNGPYTISNKVSNSPKPDVIPGYYSDNKYPEQDDYQIKKSVPVDDTGYRYPSYERSRSQERFYPQEDDYPGYHYNPGYDDESQLYPQEFNDVEVGDFTQPSDRQPAYGQGYDDYNREMDYNDPRGPGGYDGYDDDYKPPLEYNDYGGSVDGYDDRYRPDDGGYRPDDGDPYRPPHDDGFNDDYYPPAEDQYPPQDNYGNPNLPAEDDFFQREGDIYPKDEPFDQYDYEPYGERDQVPDGQEADFQGDPYNDPYYPSSVDRMPDGGPPSDDPYYGYDINPDAGEFGTSPKHNSDSLTSDRFDPSYV